MIYRRIRIIVAVLSVVSLIHFFSIALLDQAKSACQVTSPTRSIKVHDHPDGEIVNVLQNGREVYIDQVDHGKRGRPWALVSGYYEGEYRTWGYVYRDFVSCDEQ